MAKEDSGTPGRKLRPYAREWEEPFLEALAEAGGNVTAACQSIGIARTTVYDRLKAEGESGDAFRAGWEESMQRARDALHAEAVRRGVEGWDEPVYQGGKRVGTVRRFSDRMLELLLKAKIPEEYRERYEIKHRNVGSSVDEEIERLAAEMTNNATAPVPQE